VYSELHWRSESESVSCHKTLWSLPSWKKFFYCFS